MRKIIEIPKDAYELLEKKYNNNQANALECIILNGTTIPDAKWIPTMEGNGLRVECSVCKERQFSKSKYCPECGSRMGE